MGMPLLVNILRSRRVFPSSLADLYSSSLAEISF